MVQLTGELPAEQRVILAVDTSDLGRANELAVIAHEAGASIIKQGLELSSAPGSSWEFCAVNAGDAGLDWVADTKGSDIPNTTAGLVRNIVALDHKPVGITIHAHSGVDSMKEAQDVAGEAGVTLLGVTELTSVKEEELRRKLDFVLRDLGMNRLPEGITDYPDDPIVRRAMVHMLASEAHLAGIPGLVASARELIDPIKSDPELTGKFTMIPGTRSSGAATHDQKNVETPEAAIANGADTLVIGREVTGSKNPTASYLNVVAGIQRGLDSRIA